MSASTLRPRRDHEQLLRAALLPADDAAAAFAAWKGAQDLDLLDTASQRLLPLVAQNLGDRLDGADAGRIKGIARYWWATVQSLQRRAAPVLAAIGEQTGPPVVLKGWALLAAYEDHAWLRGMHDVDVLVRPADFDLAWRIVEACGLEPALERRDPRTAEKASVGFRDARGLQVDLHRRALSVALHPGAEADVWNHARAGEVGDAACLVPSPAHLLAHVVEHAARWNPLDAAPRWVADAVALVDRWDPADTPLLIAVVDQHRLAPVVVPALRYVGDTFLRPKALELADAVPRSSRVARIEWSARLRSPAERRPLDRGVIAVADAARRADPAPASPTLASVSRAAMGASRTRSIPALLAEAMYVACGRPASVRTLRSRWRVPAVELPLYGSVLGRTVPTAAGGMVGALLADGWGAPERHGTWTADDEAVLRLPVPDAVGPMRLTLTVSPLHGQRPTIDVVVGARRLRRTTLIGDDPTPVVVLVPASARSNGVLEVTLVVRRPACPAVLGLSDDFRRLGVFLWQLEVDGVGDDSTASRRDRLHGSLETVDEGIAHDLP